jgi:hypothetical protein
MESKICCWGLMTDPSSLMRSHHFFRMRICNSILHWIAELGHLDIDDHMSFLSSFLTQPRVGPMGAIYFIYVY